MSAAAASSDFPDLKTCRLCHRSLPLSRFYRRPDTTDGYRSECIRCQNAETRHRRARKRFRLSADSQAQIAATDAVEIVTDVVARRFGGSWKRWANAICVEVASEDPSRRIPALEATHRLYVLAQGERERSAAAGSPEEYGRLLAELEPEAIRRQLSEETARALVSALIAAYPN